MAVLALWLPLCLCHASTESKTGDSPGVLLLQLKPGAVSKQAPTPTAEAEQLAELQSEIQQLGRKLEMVLAAVERGVGCCGCGNVSSITSPTTTATTTTTTTTPPTALCAAFGDPHFITFDGAHTTFVGNWVLWLVKSESVWIQIISKESTGKLMGIAFGGPFMQGHTLALHKEEDEGPILTAFDGQRILNGSVDEFHLPGVLDAWRAESWQDGLHNSDVLALRTRAKFDIGPWPNRFTGAPAGGLFLLRLPGRVEVTLTGVDFISAVVSMPPQQGGQGGYCGNFNGNADDDAEPVAPSWDRAIGPDLLGVPDSENLFLSATASLLGVAADRGAPAVASPPRAQSLLDVQHKLTECPEDLRLQAEQACAQLLDARIRQDCVFDACMSGSLKSVAGTFAADILQEAVNARGVPTFLGHGECLDSQGRKYHAFATKARTDEACTALLRKLASVRGVLGAQLLRGSACEVLVDTGVDPTSELIQGGWGSSAEPQGAPGQGLISATTSDAAWNCWQLN